MAQKIEDANKEWRDLAKGYAVIAGTTAIPCLALSAYFREPSVMVGWLQSMILFPVVLCLMTLLWVITAWPVLLLVAAIVSRGETPKNFDRNQRGIIVCP